MPEVNYDTLSFVVPLICIPIGLIICTCFCCKLYTWVCYAHRRGQNHRHHITSEICSDHGIDNEAFESGVTASRGPVCVSGVTPSRGHFHVPSIYSVEYRHAGLYQDQISQALNIPQDKPPSYDIVMKNQHLFGKSA